MKIPYFQVDAFTNHQFGGNPAGVCLLDDWLPDAVLQNIAMEQNLSETAFIIRRSEGWDLRWFTPAIEVDLCGHATLASAFVIFNCLGQAGESISFQSRSGLLPVTRQGDLLALDFPSRPGPSHPVPDALVSGLGKQPIEVYRARDYLTVFESEQEILALNPNMAELAKLDCIGIIA